MSDDQTNDTNEEYNLLVTRAKTYCEPVPTSEDTLQYGPKRKSTRKRHVIQCKLHHKQKWNIECDNCSDCIKCIENTLPNGRLPTLQVVLDYLFELRSNAQDRGASIEGQAALDIMNHWIYCNVYTISRKAVVNKITESLKTFTQLREYPKSKKKDTYWERYDVFLEQYRQLFDIKYTTYERKKSQEKIWKVDMTERDEIFYENMKKTPQFGYCETFTDRKWANTVKRKLKEEESLLLRRTEYLQSKNSSIDFTEALSSTVMDFDFDDPVEEDESDADKQDILYNPSTETADEKFEVLVGDPEDDLPFKYRHVRYGLHGVRPEYYLAMNRMKSELHMSEEQAQGKNLEILISLIFS